MRVSWSDGGRRTDGRTGHSHKEIQESLNNKMIKLWMGNAFKKLMQPTCFLYIKSIWMDSRESTTLRIVLSGSSHKILF
jgi:hypothetical protein